MPATTALPTVRPVRAALTTLVLALVVLGLGWRAEDAAAAPSPPSDAGGVVAVVAAVLWALAVGATVLLVARLGRRSLADRSSPTA